MRIYSGNESSDEESIEELEDVENDNVRLDRNEFGNNRRHNYQNQPDHNQQGMNDFRSLLLTLSTEMFAPKPSEMPNFDGTKSAEEWLLQYETCTQQLPVSRKLSYLSTSLKGKAGRWLATEFRNQPIVEWQDF